MRHLLMLSLLMCLAFPAAASAGTVQMVFTPGQGSGEVDSEALFYSATPGEVNHLTYVERTTDVLVTDSAGITLGRNCTRPVPGDTTRARCVPTGGQLQAATITLGDRNDTATATASDTGTNGLEMSISGDAGNDNLSGYELHGGLGNDTLKGSSVQGGPGTDDITAGFFVDEGDANNGSDTIRGDGSTVVSYDGRRHAVRADLQGDRDDGEAGEGDRIGPGVVSLTGGRAGDVLRGNGRANTLNGEGGSDRLTSGAGDDELYATDINDSGGRTRDRLDAGSGEDRLEGSDGANRLRPGSGVDTVDGHGGADAISAADKFVDRVSCGRGRDRLRIDRLDFFGHGCERVRPRRHGVAVPVGIELFSGVEEIGCPADGPRRCRGLAAIVYKGKVRSRKRFSIRRGRVGDVQFKKLGSLQGKTARIKVRSKDRRGRTHRVSMRVVL